jgi:PPM family protein phosphatase
MKLKIVAGTDTGLKRKLNEDTYLIRDDLGLFIVADGMGGHRAGEVASRMVVNSIAEYWTGLKSKNEPLFIRPILKNISEKAKHLVNSIYNANAIVFEAQKQPEYLKMGTTVSVIATEKDTMWVANVGDSPVYLFRNGSMTLISEEHSIAAEQKKVGVENDLASSNLLMKNTLTRVIGINNIVDVYIKKIVPMPSDLILMCSDGLVNYVPDNHIRSILGDFTISLETKVKALIDEANKGGGGDNVTVVLIDCLEEDWWHKIIQRFKF